MVTYTGSVNVRAQLILVSGGGWGWKRRGEHVVLGN